MSVYPFWSRSAWWSYTGSFAKSLNLGVCFTTTFYYCPTKFITNEQDTRYDIAFAIACRAVNSVKFPIT